MDHFGTVTANCDGCTQAALNRQIPDPTLCQNSQWTSNSFPAVPAPPNPVRDLEVPKFAPDNIGTQCSELIQADFTITYTLCGALRVENRDPINPETGAMQLSSVLTLDTPYCLDGATQVPIPSFPVPVVPPKQAVVSFLPAPDGIGPLDVFDGNEDFDGPSGFTQIVPPIVQSACVRITDRATLDALTDMTDDGITDKIFIPHQSNDTSQFIGGSPITFKSDPFAGVQVDVRYVFCTNQRPVCQDDSFRVCRDSMNNSFNVLANDSDPEGELDCSTLTITTPPVNGTAMVVGCSGVGASCPGCRVEYTPNPGFAGADSFEYSITDASGCPASDSCMVSIEVCETIANDDAAVTCRNESVTFDVGANDTTSCGAIDCSSLIITSQPANGTLMINGCQITYTPATDFDGMDSFEYQISNDQRPECSDTANVSINVCRTQARPNLNLPLCKDTSITIDVLENDDTTCGNIDPNSVMIVTNPPNGMVTINGDGTITYTPNPGYVGGDGFQYSVASDAPPFCRDQANVTVDVCETIANDDAMRTCVDSAVVIPVLGNDSTSCGSGLDNGSLMITGGPTNGMAMVNGDGTVTYTPGPGFTGVNTFTYEVCSATTPACCDSATVTVEVCASVAPDVSARVCVGDSVMINLPGSTTCGTASCSIATRPTNGMASINGCTLTYTPSGGFTGIDTLTYRVASNQRPFCEDIGTITIEVCQTVALDDSGFRVCDGQPISIPVLANDMTSCGSLDPTTITIVSGPTGGTAVRNGSQILYTPNGGFNGIDTFTYQVCNDQDPACCDTATVTVEVCTTTANDDFSRTCVGDQVCVSVLANDTTTCGSIDASTLAIVTPSPNGTAVVQGNQICFTPNGGFTGNATIVYQVGNTGDPSCIDTATLTVEVCETNAQDDGPVDVCTGDSINISVLGNDTTSCGNILASSLAIVSGPSNGTVMINGSQFVYTSNAGFVGMDSFTYSVTNDSRPACQDTATVTINVCATTAQDDLNNRVCIGDSILIDVTANDSTTCGDLNCNTIQIVNPPANGSAVREGCNIRFTPGNQTGQFCFTYQIANDLGCTDTATVCVDVCEVVAANDGRLRVCSGEDITIDVTANDSASCGDLDCSSITITNPPANGTAVPVGCNIVYTAPAGFSGPVTFEYQICDNQSPACCDTAIVTLEVCDVTADDDMATTCVGEPVDIQVTANDSTSCGDLDCTSITITNPPASGTAVRNGCSITYTPAAGFTGQVTFEYEICNDTTPTCCDRATVTVDVCETVALPDEDETCPGEPVTIPVTANDSTTCGMLDCTTITIVSGPTNGAAVRDGCNVRYTPNAGFVGTDTFTYRICNDGSPQCCDTAVVTVTVNPAPDAMDDVANLPPVGNDPIDIDVLDNDLPGAPCVLVPSTVTIVQQPLRGTITNIDPLTGVVTYVPDDDFLTGADIFCYSVENDCGCIDTACVTVNRPEDDCPMRNRRMPGSLAIFTEFDNRSSNQTMITLTNTNCDQLNGSVYVHMNYVNEENCLKSDFTIFLSPCDTWTAITSAHNPNFQRGYIFAYAMNAQGQAISFNHLIANQIVLDGISSLDYGLNAVMFKAVPKGDGTLVDIDGDGNPDLDGVEYEEAPDRILIPRFLGQDEPLLGPHQSELVLINLSGGASFTTTVDLLIFNDNEEAFSAQKSFYCWDRFRLSEVSGSFLESFLDGTNQDPNEILGNEEREAGWFWINGRVANSTVEAINDPAIYAVLIETSFPNSVADLPWEECIQDNGDLCVFGPFGDGPNAVIGDNQ